MFRPRSRASRTTGDLRGSRAPRSGYAVAAFALIATASLGARSAGPATSGAGAASTTATSAAPTSAATPSTAKAAATKPSVHGYSFAPGMIKVAGQQVFYADQWHSRAAVDTWPAPGRGHRARLLSVVHRRVDRQGVHQTDQHGLVARGVRASGQGLLPRFDHRPRLRPRDRELLATSPWNSRAAASRRSPSMSTPRSVGHGPLTRPTMNCRPKS
jgi:hypothetical protein